MKVIYLNKYIDYENLSISDQDVETILSLRKNKDYLKKQLLEIEEKLVLAEETIIQRLEVGIKVKSKYPLEVKTKERYFPCWKDAFLSRVGNKEAAKVIAQTAPKVYKSLIISK